MASTEAANVTADAPMFSVVMPYYEGSVPAAYLLRALESLAAQSLRSFEVLLYHDGPMQQPFESLFDRSRYPFIHRMVATPRRHNDYGHSLRDLGIREARGEYIVHLSADNLLYPHALARIAAEMQVSRHHRPQQADPQHRIDPNRNDIVVFAILLIGAQCDGLWQWQESRNDPRHAMLLSGYPAKPGLIDCMQRVMRRSLWLSYGGWYERSPNSDGVLYARFLAERRARYVPAVLGEHW